MYKKTLPFNSTCLEHIFLVLVIAEVDITELDDFLQGPGLAGHIAGLAGLVLLGQLGVILFDVISVTFIWCLEFLLM